MVSHLFSTVETSESNVEIRYVLKFYYKKWINATQAAIKILTFMNLMQYPVTGARTITYRPTGSRESHRCVLDKMNTLEASTFRQPKITLDSHVNFYISTKAVVLLGLFCNRSPRVASPFDISEAVCAPALAPACGHGRWRI
ncbi:hypothetical protein EVAR_76923_1 [Eumeta japonica]|uniref:Uncharacterized protein n=1 Tax=Eumeta variegata TaxID=151549 RepID=A0A4C1SHQ4_EUMVA|nr:hypothetical protein EVAR_76923_1 [Eumeta japonica]